MCGSSWKASTPANQNRKTPSPRPRGLLRGLASIDAKTPLKFMSQIGSPRKANTYGGKKNKGNAENGSNQVTGSSDVTSIRNQSTPELPSHSSDLDLELKVLTASSSIARR
ncbi:hypothetical protein NL676_012683 [Syzygium grande]|nr:hypothetical protein NL676_012683 [Syzygium grande]